MMRRWLLMVMAAVCELAVAASSVDLLEHRAALNQSLLWGAYRPNLYFGMRTRSPDTVATGLMWMVPDQYDALHRLRHSCEHGDNLRRYDWTHMDGRTGGTQRIEDADGGIALAVEFHKVPGGAHGGDWISRVRVTSLSGSPVLVTLLSYARLIQPESDLKAEFEAHLSGDSISAQSQLDESLGKFSVVFSQPKSNSKDKRNFSHLLLSPPDDASVKDVVLSMYNQRIREWTEIMQLASPENRPQPPPPWVLFQLPDQQSTDARGSLLLTQTTMETPFTVDVAFLSQSAHPAAVDAHDIVGRVDAMRAQFDTKMKSNRAAMELKFTHKFGLTEVNADKMEFARLALSSVLGGLGYFYGESLVGEYVGDHPDFVSTGQSEESEGDELEELLNEELQTELADKQTVLTDYALSESVAHEAADMSTSRPEAAAALFTATPSRPFFPRGFLWDEGFHQMPIVYWDEQLTYESVQSWLGRMDADGWIAREQILGAEARSKVPPEFQTQYPHFANPPTLVLPVLSLVRKYQEKLSSQDGEATAKFTHWLSDVYPLFKRNFEWFRRTQFGRVHPQVVAQLPTEINFRELYRWRGRTPNHCLTSGLDDYPRANPPNVWEVHLDLMSWMAFYADSLHKMATFLVDSDYSPVSAMGPTVKELQRDAAELLLIRDAIRQNIDLLHWNEDRQMFCDVGGVQVDNDGVASLQHTCHHGYVSLLPLALGHIAPQSLKFSRMLDLIKPGEKDRTNADELWTPYGLRSLSAKDPHYGTKENYWRGPIWINVNFLVLRALHTYYGNRAESHPNIDRVREIYRELRTALVENVYKQWKESGFMWEQYNSETGEGKGSHPFTGWTSLVVNIMAELY